MAETTMRAALGGAAVLIAALVIRHRPRPGRRP